MAPEAYRVAHEYGVRWHPGDMVTLNGEPKPWLTPKSYSGAVSVDLNDPDGREFYGRVMATSGGYRLHGH